MFKIVEQSGCFGRNYSLTFPYGEPVRARMLTSRELRDQCVHVGCLSFGGRHRHVIIKAELNGADCFVSVDADLLSRALKHLNSVPFIFYGSDNTEYFKGKIVENVSIRMYCQNIDMPYAKCAANIILPGESESLEKRAAKIAFSMLVKSSLTALQRWRAIGVVAKDQLKADLKFQSQVALRSTTLQENFPRNLGFDSRLIKKISDLTANLQIGIFPVRFPTNVLVKKGKEGKRLYTLIRGNTGAQLYRLLPFTLLILEQKNELPTLCFRIMNESSLKMGTGAEKKVTPLVVIQGRRIALQADVTLQRVTNQAKKGLEFQRKAALEEPSIAKIYEPPFSYEELVKSPYGQGGSSEERAFVRMDFFPEDLFNHLQSIAPIAPQDEIDVPIDTPTQAAAAISTLTASPQIIRSFLSSTSSFFTYLQRKGLVYLDLKTENVLVNGLTIKFTDLKDVYPQGAKIDLNSGSPFLHSPEWAKKSMASFEWLRRAPGFEESKQSSSASGVEESKNEDVVSDDLEDVKLTVNDSQMVWQFGFLFAEILSLSPPNFIKPFISNSIEFRNYGFASEFLAKLDVSDVKIEDIFSTERISKEFSNCYERFSFVFCLRITRECLLDESKRVSLPNLIRAMNLYEKIQETPDKLATHASSEVADSSDEADSPESLDYQALLTRRVKLLTSKLQDLGGDFLDVLTTLEFKYV